VRFLAATLAARRPSLCQNHWIVPDARTDLGAALATLEADLKRLEAEYNMYFAGRLPRPPWETRGRVEAALKRLDRVSSRNYGDRFRLQTLQSRHAAFVELWDRGLRAREEGRAGPFAQRRPVEVPPQPLADHIVHVTSFSDPLREVEKVQELYESLADARREQGDKAVPFHRFAEVIRAQVSALQKDGGREVAFRVAIKDGKVAFTARALKGAPE
jgi:hypothetical protein